MKLIISFVLIILIYMILEWLYKKYKNDLDNIDDHTTVTRLELTKKINEIERRNNMNEQMINALWEEIAEKKFKEQKAKEQAKKKGKDEKRD